MNAENKTENGTDTEERTDRFEAKRERIISAAAELINERGVKGMTFVDVGRMVDLNTTSIAYYFKRKEKLAEAVFHRTLSRIEREVDEAGAEATPEAMAEALPTEAPIAAPSPETATPVAEAPQPEPQPEPTAQPVEAEAPAAETAPEPVAEKVEEQPAEKPKPKRRGWWSLGS